MKNLVLKSGTRIKLISQEMGYPEGTIFIIDKLHSDMQSNLEYECYLESNNAERCNFFDNEFQVIS